MMQMPYDGVLQLVENLMVIARKAQQQKKAEIPRLVPALQHRMQQKEELMKTQADANAWLPEAREAKLGPMDYMDRCNKFLAKLDTLGWKRSFHQSLFHAVSVSCCAPGPDAGTDAGLPQDFIRATSRSFFKMEKPGTFARMHAQLLAKNNWDCIAQEILISTPRRFGKTISESARAPRRARPTPARPTPRAPRAKLTPRAPRRREHVLRGPAPQLSSRRNQHLLHVQAHFAEDLEERHEICDDDRRSRPR
jgi:hypothetical protein